MSADILSRSTSRSLSWMEGSFRDPAEVVFRRSPSGRREEDAEDLKWAAIEKLPTMERMRRGIIVTEANDEDGKAVSSSREEEVDINNMGAGERKVLMDQIFRMVEEDNERFLRRLKSRIDRVGLELPKIEVRFQDLSVEAEAYVGGRALPTLMNAALNTLEGLLRIVGLSPSKKKVNMILKSVSGILKPSRMTLLLGPPTSGKTTLLLSLAGKIEKELRVSGKITYCGHELSEFIPQRTCAYVSQHDLHNPEMTVRETIDFSLRCLGVGKRYEMLSELSRRERDSGIKPDPAIDAFMKATALEGKKTSLMTDYLLKVLGLDVCADIHIGGDMRRGISGGQKKRVTTGEMLVGPARALFMDEISTGLDSSTTFQIIKFIRQMVHVMDGTVIISLLQPAPETFELFDDVILLSEGHIVYHGPRQNILKFFEFSGFRCPERKGVADFLQEVTSRKDQEQYWIDGTVPYRYISSAEFAHLFKSFHIGGQLAEDLSIPFDKCKIHPAALATEKYGISSWEIFKACLSREWLLMRRNYFVYIFKITQMIIISLITMTTFLRTQMQHETIADGGKYFGALFYSLVIVMFNGMAELPMTVFRLPVFYKQRDFLFFPPWAFGLSYCIVKVPLSLLESATWVILTYYTIGFAPAATRFAGQLLVFFFTHQMSLALFRFIAAAGRTMVITNMFGNFTLVLIFVLGGFVISKDNIQPWWSWCYWTSPMMYGQNAIAINEFLDPRWNTPNNDTNIDAPTVGKAILKSRGMLEDGHWYWISVGALIGFSLLLNACFILALSYLDSIGTSEAIKINEDTENNDDVNSVSNTEEKLKTTRSTAAPSNEDVDVSTRMKRNGCEIADKENKVARKGMILPFLPLSLAFNHVNYYIDMPVEMKTNGIKENRLQLLCDVSGAFRPGVLTALVGVSGAGKTTLMDVLAGRKTVGHIEGSISISGYSKKQETFARVSGYCEQNDIHSPNVTVYESLVYSAWLRLTKDITQKMKKMFVEEVMGLLELNPLKDALVGLPGVDGLSTEQRKRLTIAVELVANPSIIFMDEPTSGLDARAATIVMRTVKNTVNTGRTVVCTIHQPSIDIFEAFDELLLMKRGGQVIYAGNLGRHSHNLIEYFEAFPRVPKFCDGCNPANWMLEISSPSVEARLNLDFAELYGRSSLYQKNQDLIKELSIPSPGSTDLCFPTKYAQCFITQCVACFWKQHWSYWKNPQYNLVRFFITFAYGILFGTIFWNMGEKISTQQDLSNLLGSIYCTTVFVGATSSMAVQTVVAIERTVFYRERAAGMYSSMSYVLAQVSIEMVYISLQSLLYVLLVFPLIGFSWQADKFLWFLYFTFMCILYLTLYGMMVVGVTANNQIAAIVSSFLFGFWNLFTGFIVPRTLIPVWWRWFYWVNPLAWTMYGISISQFGDTEDLVTVPGEPSMLVRDFLKQKFGYEKHFLGYAAGVHLGFVVVFILIFACSIKFLNFQNR